MSRLRTLAAATAVAAVSAGAAVAGATLGAGSAAASVRAPTPTATAVARAAFEQRHPADAEADPVHVAPLRHRTALATASAATDPAALDLSGYDVPVGDQGSVGSCVTWAVADQMGWYAGRAGRATSFAPMYAYSQIHLTDGVDGGGSYPSSAYGLATTQGLDTRADYTQGDTDFTDLPTAAERAHAAAYRVGSFSYLYVGVPGAGARSVIEDSLASGNPVALMIGDYAAFDYVGAASRYTVDSTDVVPATYRGYHMVLVVGYDATGVRIQNEWGTSWGQDGYANLTWSFVAQYSVEATAMSGLTLPPVTPPAPVGTPTGPSVVRQLTATGSGSRITLGWAAPASSGGSGITGYRVTVNGAASTVAPTARADTLTVVPGRTYAITVAALGAGAPGVAAGTTITLAPVLATAPRSARAVLSARRTVTVSFSAPLSTGGFPVTGYVITGSASRALPASATRAVFTGLPLDTRARFTIAAVTSQGVGAPVTVTTPVTR